MYNLTVIDHFENPRNAGEIEDADGIGELGDATCGDVTRVYIKVANGRVVDVKFKTFGCAAAIASSSCASEMVIGKTLEEAARLTADDVVKKLGGLPETKVHCSVLAASALRTAIENYMFRSQND